MCKYHIRMCNKCMQIPLDRQTATHTHTPIHRGRYYTDPHTSKYTFYYRLDALMCVLHTNLLFMTVTTAYHCQNPKAKRIWVHTQLVTLPEPAAESGGKATLFKLPRDEFAKLPVPYHWSHDTMNIYRHSRWARKGEEVSYRSLNMGKNNSKNFFFVQFCVLQTHTFR